MHPFPLIPTTPHTSLHTDYTAVGKAPTLNTSPGQSRRLLDDSAQHHDGMIPTFPLLLRWGCTQQAAQPAGGKGITNKHPVQSYHTAAVQQSCTAPPETQGRNAAGRCCESAHTINNISKSIGQRPSALHTPHTRQALLLHISTKGCKASPSRLSITGSDQHTCRHHPLTALKK